VRKLQILDAIFVGALLHVVLGFVGVPHYSTTFWFLEF